MRVAAILPAYPPRSRVGSWLCTHQFLRHLAAAGYHVDVFTADKQAVVETLDGVNVGPGFNDYVVDCAVACADVVVSHLGDYERPAALAAKWGKPNVRIAHGHISDPSSMARAALIVFNSHSLAASVDCSSPYIVCRPPVHAAEFATTPGDRVTLVNLSEAKGGELFWRLVRCSTRRFLGVKGWGAQYIDHRYANAEVIDTTQDMRGDVYARTRILLMPSAHESWGMVGVEALASGIPVIAHPTPGLRESLGDAGIFVDRDDPYAWLDEIERLHDPVEWARASAAALARSAELDPQPDLERFTEAIESLAVLQCV